MPLLLKAQLTTGLLKGTVHNMDGRPASHFLLFIAGRTGIQIAVFTDSEGQFMVSLPYGTYALSSKSQHSVQKFNVYVDPLSTVSVDLVIDLSGSFHTSPDESLSALHQTPSFGVWSERAPGTTLPAGFSLQSVVSTQAPGALAVPLNFTGLADNRLTLISTRGLSWTNTRFTLEGLDATDSYQPGRPVLLPDMQSVAEVVVRTDSALTTANSYGNEVHTFVANADTSWHAAISGFGTSLALSSSNIDQPRGMVQQPQRFNWFSRDELQVGGPVTRWADLFASVAGQWASQSIQSAPPGESQNSRTLFATVRGNIRAGPHDWLDAEWSGSRLHLSNWGVPAGIEALTGRLLSPEFALPEGFPDEAETDWFSFVQGGWTHQDAVGTLQLRYGYSVASLHTWPATQVTPNQSRIELLGSIVTGAPPLATLGSRRRQEIAAAWQPVVVNTGRLRHQITIGGNWESSLPSNQMTTPSDLNVITAAGTAAYVVEYNTPVHSLERVHETSAYVGDHLVLRDGLSLQLGALADFSRGSLPAQSSPAGAFTSVRNYSASGDLIAWNSISPRAAFAWQVPYAPRLVIHGGYLRLYSPLAGRYLDYGNPNSLGGSVYQWVDRNGDGWFQPNEQGALVLRFGGPYSSISPSLQRPYSDEFDVSAQFTATRKTIGTVQVFRRDEKHRIAAVDIGLGADAFTPVQILDPGPDGIPGTFDDRQLTVYQQNPATFGNDRYLLTNPAGLRELNVGLVAEIRTQWRAFVLDAAFTAEKAWGPTNPGNAYVENDPDVIGSLFMDPNSTNLTLARSYVDRAYLGKVEAVYWLPPSLGRLEVATVANYMDGLPFARELLVTGFASGPLLVPTTVRGSPEGGNRAQYVLNWNLRLGREFRLGRGRLAAFADILNVSNSAQAIQQNDLTGPTFNLRLPVAIQPARFVRLGLACNF